jgi:hypothetical protein
MLSEPISRVDEIGVYELLGSFCLLILKLPVIPKKSLPSKYAFGTFPLVIIVSQQGFGLNNQIFKNYVILFQYTH